jgi:hypothetical protein
MYNYYETSYVQLKILQIVPFQLIDALLFCREILPISMDQEHKQNSRQKIFGEAIEALQALPAKMGGSPKGRIDKTTK